MPCPKQLVRRFVCLPVANSNVPLNYSNKTSNKQKFLISLSPSLSVSKASQKCFKKVF